MTNDLTSGKVSKALFKYTLPMFISVIFQQLYNIADSSIAGKFAGESALAAIGASYPITMIFMAICTGCNIGCTVVLSHFFGAKDIKSFKTGASTAIIFGVALSSVLTLLAVILSPLMLTAINTPENIFADAVIYLRIYLGGFIFLFLYNMVNGIFNAMGDSRTPLYFLIASSVGNVLLDILFVAVLGYGVAGAAIATLIAQGLACIGALTVVLVRLRGLTTSSSPVRFSRKMLSTILFVAIPSVLQSSFVSVGNLLIQSLINSCGPATIAGFSSAFKLNTFFLTCITTIGNSVSAFTAQNIGAGKISRVKRGLKCGILLGFVLALPFVILYTFAGGTMMLIFLEDGGSEALAIGKLFLTITSPFYFFITTKLICDGVLKGSKSMALFMVSTFTDLVARVVLSFILFYYFDIYGIFASWPVGWILGALLSGSFYLSGLWKKRLPKEI